MVVGGLALGLSYSVVVVVGGQTPGLSYSVVVVGGRGVAPLLFFLWWWLCGGGWWSDPWPLLLCCDRCFGCCHCGLGGGGFWHLSFSILCVWWVV